LHLGVCGRGLPVHVEEALHFRCAVGCDVFAGNRLHLRDRQTECGAGARREPAVGSTVQAPSGGTQKRVLEGWELWKGGHLPRDSMDHEIAQDHLQSLVRIVAERDPRRHGLRA
jgi:hypothetical protein